MDLGKSRSRFMISSLRFRLDRKPGSMEDEISKDQSEEMLNPEKAVYLAD